MARPTRSLLLFVVVLAVALVAVPRLPGAALWGLAAVGAGVVGVSLVAGRQFFVSRAAMREQRWEDAVHCLERFLAEQRGGGWRARVAVLFAGIYTADGIALALNTLGAVRLNQRRLADARAHFAEALARDPLYAMPHVNLAIAAALEGDAVTAEAEATTARRLGFRRRGLQAAVRAALAGANTAVGRVQAPASSQGRP